jgi:hypothetical protein
VKHEDAEVVTVAEYPVDFVGAPVHAICVAIIATMSPPGVPRVKPSDPILAIHEWPEAGLIGDGLFERIEAAFGVCAIDDRKRAGDLSTPQCAGHISIVGVEPLVWEVGFEDIGEIVRVRMIGSTVPILANLTLTYT